MIHDPAHYWTAERSTGQDRGTLYLLRHSASATDHRNVGKVTIETLPEEILLEIFSFYMCEFYFNDIWETLVHVCRRWRSIVFAAPQRLNLQLLCTSGTPASKMLDIWPALPILLRVDCSSDVLNDNVFAALEKYDRICKVYITSVSDAGLEKLAGTMQVPFPALTSLFLHSSGNTAPLSESLLGGSAPNLQSLCLIDIAFPALPKLLLSSPGLVRLSLCGIPDSGYIPPDSMVDCLASLTRLETLEIRFQYSQLRRDQASRRSPPLTRTVFPVLSGLVLKGVTEYLDQILAHIEAPPLDHVHIIFFDLPSFDISRISQCIGHTETVEAFDQAYMHFHYDINVVLISRNGTTSGKMLTLSLQWKDSGWKLRGLTWNSSDCFSEPFDLCDLKGSLLPRWAKDMDIAPWLHLVRFFTATEYMYLTQGLAACVAPALQGLAGAGVTEVLPVLRNIFVEHLDSLGPVQEALGQFVATRQLLSGHPVGVQCWVRGEGQGRR